MPFLLIFKRYFNYLTQKIFLVQRVKAVNEMKENNGIWPYQTFLDLDDIVRVLFAKVHIGTTVEFK